MNVLVNYSGNNFEESRNRLNKSALKFGIGRIESFDENYLLYTEFYKRYSHIFSAPKGQGYWLWKPYFIQEALSKTSENDIIVYSDAGIEIIRDISPLTELCQKSGFVFFANGNLKNRHWIKRDCFVLMDCDEVRFREGLQVDAAFCLFKNTEPVRDFVRNWLKYCCDVRIISDSRNVMGRKNSFGFRFHRHDQAVLSLMALKWNLELYRQPSQFGNHYKSPEFRISGEFNCVNQFNRRQVNYYSTNPFNNSPYFQLLDHHRTKTEIFKSEKLNVPKRIIRSGRRRIKKIIKLLSRQ